ALAESLAGLADERERALVGELCYGTVRWYPRLQRCLDTLLEKPLKKRDTAVRAALLLGLYQLMYTRVPEHAAVDESVALVRAAGKPWAAGLVNAVLRNFQRQRSRVVAALDDCDESRFAHPAWLIEATRAAWRDDWCAVLEAGNQRPPQALRVNARRDARDAYLGELAAHGVDAHAIAHTTHGVRLEQPRDVHAIPGFDDGRVSVQDGAAQLAADLLDAREGMRVLDACAAPGGKSTHILERTPGITELVCLDRDAQRIVRIRENLERLDLEATLVCADAAVPREWWDGRAFDRILVDAPCSGTGVVRRHPDIKLHRRRDDIEALADMQLGLLSGLWSVLAPRGRLLYATCSYLPRENDHVLAEFLANHPHAVGLPLETPCGRATGHGRQILPGEDTMDGFYYALLGHR
ncbi:MAG: 16S rRNA (cytosine(967)-C(5))-methyltransferase RsmB, partial [Gammaproteobacteria bacterium]|nr:16S rRNA (cytosine(967)-C(5))-methyltransferase RsmB [Gammaproteobacteria bacterium]